MRNTIDMAREAGLEEMWEFTTGFTKRLKAFEALVRADERSVERAWVGLTDEEKITMSGYDLHYAALIGQVERKLKEKNSD